MIKAAVFEDDLDSDLEEELEEEFNDKSEFLDDDDEFTDLLNM